MATIDDADALLMWSYEAAEGSLRIWPNLHQAAEALGWPLDRAQAAFAYLAQTGFIEPMAIGGVYALTTTGIDAAEQRLGNNTERWSDRWAFLKLSYERAEGDIQRVLQMWKTGEQLEWEPGQTENAFMYLEKKGLVKPQTLGGGYSITEYAVDLIERATSRPSSPTGTMPPLSSLQVHIKDSFHNATLINTLIGSPGGVIGSPVTSISTVSTQEVMDALDELSRAVQAADLPNEKQDDIEADIETCRTQLRKREPTKSVISSAWQSIKAAAGAILQKSSIATAVRVIENYLG